MSQRAFGFDDPVPCEWVYTCRQGRDGGLRWRAHRILKSTAKRLFVTRRPIPATSIRGDTSAPDECARPFQLNREAFERQGWVQHTGKWGSAFFARQDAELVETWRRDREEWRRDREETRARLQAEWRARRDAMTPEDLAAEQEELWRHTLRASVYLWWIRNGVSPSADAQVLGLSTWPCSMDTLKAAYRRQSKQTHPDVGGSAEAFRRVNEAYVRLAAAM